MMMMMMAVVVVVIDPISLAIAIPGLYLNGDGRC